MPKVLFSVFVLSFATCTMAQDDWRAQCDAVAEISQSVMKSRQGGVAMSDMMKIADGNKLTETIIIQAFESPRYNTEEIQVRTIEEFRDQWYLECVKSQRPAN